MSHYKRIPFWINKSRLKFLKKFRTSVETYFDNSSGNWMVDRRVEEPAAQEARIQINRNMDEAYRIIVFAGVNPTITYTPPAAIGGYIQRIDLIHNIFNLTNYQIPAAHIFDNIDRATGIYEKNYIKSIIRTFNPFFWISEFFIYITKLPFKLIGRIGFDQDKAEQSLIGKILKGIFYLITMMGSFLTILHLLDLLTPFKQFIRDLVTI